MSNAVEPRTKAGAPGWARLLAVSRFGASLIFMVYSGAMPAVIAAWSMTPAMAGSIQTAFNVGYAVSLVAASWLADRIGARRVFVWSSWLAAASALLFALFARSPWSALVLFAVQGLAQGGTYTPSIMLVAQGIAPARRGAAVGGLLAAGSLGYFASVAVAQWASVRLGYGAAFLICAAGPVGAALAGTLAVAGRPNLVASRPAAGRQVWTASRGSALLILGYTAHCWELLGMWAWMPAFLASAPVNAANGLAALEIAAAIHLTGAVSAMTTGRLSDLVGRRRVLVGLGMLGAACSFAVGWTQSESATVLWLVAVFYGFAAIGDSPVLSTAMTEEVAPARLGIALALRSILGFGAGGLAPLAFGNVLTFAGSWPAAFSLLGLGGLGATVAALLLPSDGCGRVVARKSEAPSAD